MTRDESNNNRRQVRRPGNFSDSRRSGRRWVKESSDRTMTNVSAVVAIESKEDEDKEVKKTTVTVPIEAEVDDTSSRLAGSFPWFPVTTSTPCMHSSSATIIDLLGGDSVLLRDTEKWPQCATCSLSSPLAVRLFPVCQFLVSRLPEEFKTRSGGMLQIFACPTTGCKFNFSRIVSMHSFGSSSWSEKKLTPVEMAPFQCAPTRFVTEWKKSEVYDFVHPEDAEAKLGTLLSVEDWKRMASFSMTMDKLGGFPVWLEPRTHLSCSICPPSAPTMSFFMQIDCHWQPEDGCAAVFRCPRHPNEIKTLVMFSVAQQ